MKLKPLFMVAVDEDDRITIAPPKDGWDEKMFKTNYGAIGQMLEQLGLLIQRKKYPHFLNKQGYTHVVPLHDVFDHHPDVGCSCGGLLNVNDKTFIHHAMDGRGDYEKGNQNWDIIDIEPN